MGFFLQLHRSVLDPSFYKEAIAYPRRTVIGFVFGLLFFTVFLTGLSQTYYLIDKQKGISDLFENAFGGMEIRDGVLDPKVATPYFPPAYKIMPILDRFFGTPHLFSGTSDSVIVVDTGAVNSYLLHAPIIVMGADRLSLLFNKQTSFQIPYRNFLFGTERLRFTSDSVRAFLIKNFVTLLIYAWITNFTQYVFLFGFSILFLATAAFIFRIEKEYNLKKYIKIACFSVSPLSIGIILVSISGVKLEWTWHLLIFLSTVIMFRAIVASTKNSSDDSGEKIWR